MKVVKAVKKVISKKTASKVSTNRTAVKARVATNKADTINFMMKANKESRAKSEVWATHPGAASFKSNQRLVKKDKWSSPKQIARYQKKEAKSELKGEKRGLKAANKPTNKTGSKQDRADRSFYQNKPNLIKNADPLRPNRVRGGSLGAMKKYGGFGVATAKRTPKEAAFKKEVTEDLNKKRRGK